MRIFTDIETLDERLGEKQLIIQEYLDVNEGLSRCSFISVERNEAGRNTRVICGFRKIAAETEEIERQNNLIHAAFHVVRECLCSKHGYIGSCLLQDGAGISDRYREEIRCRKL